MTRIEEMTSLLKGSTRSDLFGGEVCRVLAAKGLPFRALVRAASDPRRSRRSRAWLSPIVGFDAANAKATVYGTGDQPIGWISFKDVAAFAVESLANPEADNCVLPLGGPQSLSPHQVIQAFEQAGGKTFEVTHNIFNAVALFLKNRLKSNRK